MEKEPKAAALRARLSGTSGYRDLERDLVYAAAIGLACGSVDRAATLLKALSREFSHKYGAQAFLVPERDSAEAREAIPHPGQEEGAEGTKGAEGAEEDFERNSSVQEFEHEGLVCPSSEVLFKRLPFDADDNAATLPVLQPVVEASGAAPVDASERLDFMPVYASERVDFKDDGTPPRNHHLHHHLLPTPVPRDVPEMERINGDFLAKVFSRNFRGIKKRVTFEAFLAAFFQMDWCSVFDLRIMKLGGFVKNWKERTLSFLPSGFLVYKDPRSNSVCGAINMNHCQCVLDFKSCFIKWPPGTLDGVGLFIPEAKRTYYIAYTQQQQQQLLQQLHRHDKGSNGSTPDFDALKSLLRLYIQKEGSDSLEEDLPLPKALGLLDNGTDKEVEQALTSICSCSAQSEKFRKQIHGFLKEIVLLMDRGTAVSVKYAVRTVMNLAHGDRSRRRALIELNVLPKLCDLLRGPADIRRDAAGALWNLSLDVDTARELCAGDAVGALRAARQAAFEAEDRIMLMNATGALLVLDPASTSDLLLREPSILGGAEDGLESPTGPMPEASPAGFYQRRPVDKLEDLSDYIMISYSWAQQETCLRIRAALAPYLGNTRIWIDVQEMRGNILRTMAKAVSRARLVLMAISPEYEASKNCTTEAMYAYQLNKPIIPVRVCSNKEWSPDPSEYLAALCAQRMYYTFSEDADFDQSIEALLKDIQSQLSGSWEGD